MNLDFIIGRMTSNIDAISGLAGGLGDDQYRWRPAPGKWSIQEVLCHLYDEEQFDFRPRIDVTLHHPDEQWPPWDPEVLVTERKYNDQDPAETLAGWIEERRRSIEWLIGLSRPDWDKSYTHPKFGVLRTGDLLAAWLAHDFLHIGQLGRLHVAYIGHDCRPFHTKYAAP
jgi:hypothetical protein